MNRRHIMSYITGIELWVKSELSFIILQAYYTPAQHVEKKYPKKIKFVVATERINENWGGGSECERN